MSAFRSDSTRRDSALVISYAFDVNLISGLRDTHLREVLKLRVDRQKLQDKVQNMLVSGRLADAEEKAHKITAILRSRGVEAYEFHDRHESLVCVGSFDWVTRETGDTVLNNPEIVRIVNKCKPEIKNLPGIPNAVIPKSIQGIPLDPEPTPILVPKVDGKRNGALSFLRR